MTIQSVCVYCGSSNRVDDVYKNLAAEVGTALAQRGKRIVYGGGHVGLMGVVADSALKAGAEVIGIIPEHIRAHEIQHKGLTELHVVENMHMRKSLMVEKSDAFVILPGGFGTLDEAFEVLTWKQLALHNKPVIIYNAFGFWDPLLKLIDHLINTGFAPKNNYLIFKTVTSLDEMFTALSAPVGDALSPDAKWS